MASVVYLPVSAFIGADMGQSAFGLEFCQLFFYALIRNADFLCQFCGGVFRVFFENSEDFLPAIYFEKLF